MLGNKNVLDTQHQTGKLSQDIFWRNSEKERAVESECDQRAASEAAVRVVGCRK